MWEAWHYMYDLGAAFGEHATFILNLERRYVYVQYLCRSIPITGYSSNEPHPPASPKRGA